MPVDVKLRLYQKNMPDICTSIESVTSNKEDDIARRQ